MNTAELHTLLERLRAEPREGRITVTAYLTNGFYHRFLRSIEYKWAKIVYYPAGKIINGTICGNIIISRSYADRYYLCPLM